MDVRRVWECPACGRRIKRHGGITNYECHCQDSPVRMRLVENQRDHREYQPYIVPEIGADELLGDEEPAAVETQSTEPLDAVVETLVAPETEVPLDAEEATGESEVIDDPPAFEITIDPAVETPSAETPSEPDPAPQESTESAPEKKSRKGRSRRRRGGRKRSRGQGSPEEG